MANVRNGMKIRDGSLTSAAVALLVCFARAEAQDGELWTFDTGG